MTEFEIAPPAPLEIRFCCVCPLFEPDLWQPKDVPYKQGWCRGRSYYRTLDNEMPHYVYTRSDSFCDPNTILEDND